LIGAMTSTVIPLFTLRFAHLLVPGYLNQEVTINTLSVQFRRFISGNHCNM